MNLNLQILNAVRNSGAQIIAVTKYLDKDETHQVLEFLQKDYADIFYGIGENRVAALEVKKIPREKVHFIGNLQSRDLGTIVKSAQFVQSVDNLKYIELLNKKCVHEQKIFSIFIQVNISEESQKRGVMPKDLKSFLNAVKAFDNLKLEGISALGFKMLPVVTPKEIERKKAEFEALVQLRDEYLPQGKISAGTSQDYEYALEAGVDIVRVGKALLKK